MFSERYFKSGMFARRYFAPGEALTVKAGRMPRRIDFDPPGWAELGAGPFEASEGATGVTLEQSPAGAMPDRPGAGGSGLSIVMTAGGTGGAYHELDLGAARSAVHLRWWMNAEGAHGGEVELVRLVDGMNQPVGAARFDALTRTVMFSLESGESVGAALSGELDWQCVEIAFDASAGAIGLWINGMAGGAQDAEPSGVTVRRAWVGAVSKAEGAAGALLIDEVALGEAYLGPVVREPTRPWASDPARWAVVYNTGDAHSIAWAAMYRAARGVPYANLIGLALPLAETITGEDFVSMTAAISDYLERNGLSGSIMGLLLGYRVPGVADFFGSMESTASLLQTADPFPGPVVNPLMSESDPLIRPAAPPPTGVRMTARIDGPTLADALALVERATEIMDQGLGDGLTSAVYLEPVFGSSVSGAIAMENWPGTIDRMRTRLPVQLPPLNESGQSDGFGSITEDGFYWGVAQDEASFGFFGQQAGRRVFCAQWQAGLVTGGTMRTGAPTQWLGRALAAGYAAGAGSPRLFSPSAIARIDRFFEALRLGWTLAEAWMVSTPLLREGVFLAGDPLMTVAMPRAGWDIFGPMSALEEMDVDEPSVMLRADERSLALDDTLRVGEGHTGLYVIRRVDAQGRSEAGVKHVRIASVNGHAKGPPMPPLWPDAEGWLVRADQGALRLRVVWERSVARARVELVVLEARSEATGNVSTAAVLPPTTGGREIEVEIARPDEAMRYRWRVQSSDGVAWVSPWSAAVFPAPTPTMALQLVGGVM